MAARKLFKEFHPRRVKAYCPFMIDSFPVPHAAEGVTTATLNACVLLWAVGVVESVTVIEKVDEPVSVGVPERVQFVPDPLNVSHDGNVEPLATVQV
jgi:hypothetical protein